MDFDGKTVLITGASSGIGSAIAVAFAQQGADLALVGRNRERLEQTAERCRKYGKKTVIITGDMTIEEDVARAVSETVTAFGKIDVLVNGVGAGATSQFQDDNALRVFEDVLKTNLTSAVTCCHKALPHLIKSKGNIVNISSICATNVITQTSWAYCASKAALDHFTRCVASEVAPLGVRVNSVNPGPVKTKFWDYVTSDTEEDKFYDMVSSMTPQQRICEADEVADLVVYVAASKAKSITGSAFVIDNGFKVRT